MEQNSTNKSRRGGRPASEDPRKFIVSGKLNRAEHAQVMSKIRDAGLTRSEAVRLLLLNDRLPEKVFGGIDITSSEAYANLQPLQSNINQIAHWLNKVRPTNIDAETLTRINKNVVVVGKLLQEIRHRILTTGVAT